MRRCAKFFKPIGQVLKNQAPEFHLNWFRWGNGSISVFFRPSLRSLRSDKISSYDLEGWGNVVYMSNLWQKGAFISFHFRHSFRRRQKKVTQAPIIDALAKPWKKGGQMLSVLREKTVTKGQSPHDNPKSAPLPQKNNFWSEFVGVRMAIDPDFGASESCLTPKQMYRKPKSFSSGENGVRVPNTPRSA